jgi:OPT family small oligopeptide transporter
MSATVEEHNHDNFLEYGLQTDKSTESLSRSSSKHDLSILASGRISPVSTFFDPNIDSDADTLEDDSPYPEVRSAVANYDDDTMPVSTIRAWVLGICWAIILPGINQFFYMRYPSIVLGGLVAQLVAFPVGRVWARVVPNVKVFGHSLNTGPFTIKEHVLVTIMAAVGAGSAYATDIVAVQRVYYNQHFSFVYGWMLVMSTQLIGFSIGGVARRFLVSPPSMIWPNTLVQCALFNTLHSQSYAGIGRHDGISRERFFLTAFLGAAVWYIFPGYLFQALSFFSWVCWLAPNNKKINQMFGYRSGLGFSLLSFDWTQIALIGSPLATPWWAEANIAIGFLFFFWFLTPILYYSNVWNSQYMPISSRGSYDNTGQPYDLARITQADGTIDMEAFKEYSPLYLSLTFVMCYGLSFTAITATITHTMLYFWKPIRLHFGRSLQEQPDVHARLMSNYRQVPEWWYACIFVATFMFACICVELWHTAMPIWALIIALLIAFLYVVPIGMIQAVTNFQIGLNVITELIVGFMLPGRPIAMMIFKTYGYITMAQAMQFTADFKLGHYMKIPPRPMFWAQVIATIIAGTVQLGVQSWMFTTIPDLCSSTQQDGFICPGTQVFGTASVVWGVIGPSLQFSKGQVYYSLLFFLPIGAICPVILYVISRRYPRSILNYLNFPLMVAGLGSIPPASAVNYVPWAIVGFTFQFVIRRWHFSFWAKYNYVLSAALDGGTAIGVMLVYFCLEFPLAGTIGANTIQRWWGNRVYMETADWQYVPLKTVPAGERFGPSAW